MLCNKCKKEKLESDFSPSQFKKGKWCKQCVKFFNTQYRLKNIEKCKQYNKIDKYQIKRKEYKQSKKYKEWNKQYYKDNKKLFQQYYMENKAHIKNKSKKWAHENKHILNKKFRERYRNEPGFKLKYLISGSITKWLYKLGLSKNKESINEYLPYSMEQLKIHLESQFESWMNWNNHGIYNPDSWNNNDQSTWTWQIDHIIPQCKLPYTSMKGDNFDKCWALSNLRPLSAKENIILGSRLTRNNM